MASLSNSTTAGISGSTLITSKAPTTPSTTGPNGEQVVGYWDLTILVLIILIAVATFPRALARFHQPNAWKDGWLLKPRKSTAARARDMIRRSLHLGVAPTPQRGLSMKRSLAGQGDEGSDEGHGTIEMAKYATRRDAVTIPAHVPSWYTLLFPVSSFFARPFFKTGFSIGQATLYLVLFVAIVLGIFIAAPGTANLDRAGWFVVGQAPLIVILGSKNSLIGLLTGRGYERLNWIHRWIGKLMFGAAVYHALGFIVMWLQKDDEAHEMATHVPAWLALGGLSLPALASIPIIRRTFYNVFFHAHWIGYITFMIAICYHVQDAIYWSLGAFFMLGLDHVARLVKSYYTTANIEALPDSQMTRVEIPTLTRGWRAGQHVRIRALSSKMGRFSWAEAHPFTIASVARVRGGEGVVLYVKSAGDWTRKLHDVARNYNQQITPDPFSDEKAVRVEKGIGNGATMKMIIEGPYGGPGNAVFTSFTSTLFVCGGSGITFGLSAVEEIIRDTEKLQSRTRIVKLVWIVQDPATVLELLPTLETLLDRAGYIPTLSFRIIVHYTRAISPSFSDRLKRMGGLPRHMFLEAGRPMLDGMLEAFVQKTDTLSRGKLGLTGVMVGVCGPKSLAEEVKKAERGLPWQLRRNVGGVEVMEEVFGW